MAREDRTVPDELDVRPVNEEDVRPCRDIPDGASREVPRDFVLLIASYVLTKTGDAIANPTTTLNWIMDAIGAPVPPVSPPSLPGRLL